MTIYEEYATELMLGGYAIGHRYGGYDGKYCTYYEYACKITNPGILDKYLLDNGYYRPPTAEESFTLFTVEQLKIFLKQYGLKTTGNKAELITRLVENAPKDFVNEIHSKCDSLFLSDKGMKHYLENIDFELLHKNGKYNISIEEYGQYRYDNGKIRDFYETVYLILHDRIKRSKRANPHDLRAYADICEHMQCYEDSLFSALVEMYININTLNNRETLYFSRNYIKMNGINAVCEEILHTNFFPLDNISHINNLYNYYSHSMTDKIYSSNIAEHELLSKNEFASIVDNIHNNAYFDGSVYNEIIAKNYAQIAKKILSPRHVFLKSLFSKRAKHLGIEMRENQNTQEGLK